MTETTTAPSRSAPDAPLSWGSAREMNPVEALMWRAEADPRLRSHGGVIDLLDTAPDWDRLVAAHEWGSRMVPRLRQKVVEPAFGVGTPTWVVDPDFDLHYHLRRSRLPAPGGWKELLAATEQLFMTPFDKARSPWEAVLFEDLYDGHAAYVLKMHHSVTDGMGAIQMLSQLHSRSRESNPDKPQPGMPEAETVNPMGVLARQVARDAGRVPDVVRTATGALGALIRPDRAARDALRFGASLRRVMADPPTKPSPLLRHRSLSWRFIALDVPFADLRGAGKAAGGSLNDAYLAALLGAFRMYHDELGQPIQSMPLGVPISVRKEGDAEGGNRFAGARLAGPVGIVDPTDRMAEIRRQMTAARGEPALDNLSLIAPALARLPGPVISLLAGGMTKGNDLQASNIPGIRDDVYLAGAQIERSYCFGPLPGCAAMSVLLTHGDQCCITVNFDPAAITDADRFGRCLKQGFEEVLALNPDAHEPVART